MELGKTKMSTMQFKWLTWRFFFKDVNVFVFGDINDVVRSSGLKPINYNGLFVRVEQVIGLITGKNIVSWVWKVQQ